MSGFVAFVEIKLSTTNDGHKTSKLDADRTQKSVRIGGVRITRYSFQYLAIYSNENLVI